MSDFTIPQCTRIWLNGVFLHYEQEMPQDQMIKQLETSIRNALRELMFMFNDFPAALTYYYLLQNLLGIAHQWIIQKFFINDEKLRKQIEDNKKNPKAQSSWQKKLADIQKQAAERQNPKK